MPGAFSRHRGQARAGGGVQIRLWDKKQERRKRKRRGRRDSPVNTYYGDGCQDWWHLLISDLSFFWSIVVYGVFIYFRFLVVFLSDVFYDVELTYTYITRFSRDGHFIYVFPR